MRETDKNNLPIPVCFFFQLESHGRPQTVCLTYHMFKDVFVWHPFWKVSEFLDRLMEKTLGSKTGQTTKYSSENKKKTCPLKINGFKTCFFFSHWESPFFGGTGNICLFFVWGCIPWSLKLLQKACWKSKKLMGWKMTPLSEWLVLLKGRWFSPLVSE